ncbi:LamG-like jellyroll fold domain-containing protein [Phycisphaerales bacterium AB-hyl4]|uniref:LamG-like jellyroll fold domain-containing protein n=1 Tax=Natronomicrosphaera hydrolytica TaxID=3242702 RepID=A0ABV4U9Q4_9BACT
MQVKCSRWTWASLVCVLSMLTGGQAAGAAEPTFKDSLAEGLLLFASFDDPQEPIDFARGPTAANGEAPQFVAGRTGRALAPRDSGWPVQLHGNLDFGRGTLSFFIRPDWQWGDRTQRVLLATTNFELRLPAEHEVLLFMTGNDLPTSGFAWDYGCTGRITRAFTQGWQHIVLTWDAEAEHKQIYLNGERIAEQQTNLIRPSQFSPTGPLWLARGAAPGAYDELGIWDRVLSEDEIAALADQGPTLRDAAREKEHTPLSPLRVQVDGQRSPGSLIVDPGERFTSRFGLKNRQPEPIATEITLRLLDYREREVDRTTREVSIAPGTSMNVEHAFSAQAYGPYKVEVSYTLQGRDHLADAASFVVWPEADAPNPDSFFGYHINSFRGSGVFEQAVRLGAAWNRGHNMVQHTWWPRVQPEPGEFAWQLEDKMQRLDDAGMTLLGQWFGTPYWAAREADRSPPEHPLAYPSGDLPDLQAFATYVRKTIERFPQIRYWETWNEPDVSLFWRGTPEQLVEVARVAYETAKAVDPELTVMGVGVTGSARGWHRQIAEAGLFDYVDVITYHAYHPADIEPERLWDMQKNLVEHFRSMAREHHGHELPLWDTESGNVSTTWLRHYEHESLPAPHLRHPIDAYEAALSMVQANAFMQVLGVERSFHYMWNLPQPNDYRSSNAVDPTGTPKPKLLARLAMERMVGRGELAGHVQRDEGRLWFNVYAMPDGSSVLFGWTGRGGQVELTDMPGAFTRYDLMANASDATSMHFDQEPAYYAWDVSADEAISLLERATAHVHRTPQPVGAAREPIDADLPAYPDFAAALDQAGGLFTLDLRPFANMGLADETPGTRDGGWTDQGPMNDARDLTIGTRELFGVPFEVIDPQRNDGRAVITMRGENLTPDFPQRVGPIEVNRRIRTLYFMHAGAWAVDGEIGHYLIRYRDGSRVKVPVRVGEQLNDWWRPPSDGMEARAVGFTAEQTLTGEPQQRYIYVYEWQNPEMDKAIDSIEVVSANGQSTLLVLAISGVAF